MNRRYTPSAGVVVGVVAIVLGLTGGAIALPGKNKVDKNDIQKNAVKSKQIKTGAVKAADIKDGSVGTSEIADGVIPEIPEIPEVPEQAYGLVTKAGADVAVGAGAVGIVSATNDGGGIICYDLAFKPVSGTANVSHESVLSPGSTVEMVFNDPGCDAKTVTKLSTTGALEDEDVWVHFIK